MDAPGQKRGGGSIHEAVAGERPEAGEAAGRNPDGKMRAFAGTGVAGMRGAVVAQDQALRRQGLPQQCLQLPGGRAHDLSLPDSCSQASWPMMNTNMEPVRPHSFTFTQVASDMVKAT